MGKKSSFVYYIVILLLMAVLISALIGTYDEKPLTGFLTYLSEMPQVSMDWLLNGMRSISVPEGWLGDIIQYFLNVIQFIVTLVGGLINFIVFAFEFVRWLLLS